MEDFSQVITLITDACIKELDSFIDEITSKDSPKKERGDSDKKK